MSTSTGTGFCRVTVAAPDARIDVALPEDVALVDIYPEILRLSGQSQAEGAPTGYHLVRRDGTVLDAGQSLAQQQILDGDLLLLKPFAESLPLPVFDDVSDAVASAVKRNRSRWSDDLMHTVGLTAGVLLLVMMAFALWFSNPVDRDMHRLPGIIAGVVGIVLVALAGVRARVYDDHGSSIALGLAALPHLLIAGSGIFPCDPTEGPGRLQLLVGCVTVLIASVLLVVLLPRGDAPFVAAAFLSAIGTLAVFGAILTDAAPSEVAAVTAVVAKGSFEGGGDTESVDFVKIGNQAKRGHELLLGLVAGCAALVVGSAGIVLGFSDNMWAQLLAMTAGITIMLRARLFDYTAQVACLTIAGILTIVLLILGIVLHPPMDIFVQLQTYQDSGPLNIRTVWFSSSIAVGAAVLVGVGLVVPRKGVTPFWGRIFDIFDGLVLLSLVPLCLAVLDVYNKVRGLTGN